MQRDHRLAGARTAGDRDHALAGRADGAVLLGLDGRHDRVHRAVAGPGQLRHQRTLAHHRQVGVHLGVEQVVLDPDDPLAAAAQDASAYDAPGLGVRRLVEHRGRRGPPVDQHHVAPAVPQPDPPDVARLRWRARPVGPVGPQVEPSEHEPLVGRVEAGQPLGGLEDHRVPLHQSALVTQPGACVPLTGHLLSRSGGLLQLAVDPVDELLLVSDLASLDVLVQANPLPQRDVSPAGPVMRTRRVRRESNVTRALLPCDPIYGKVHPSGRGGPRSRSGLSGAQRVIRCTNSVSWVRLRHSTISTISP